jgi:hypothetical protein
MNRQSRRQFVKLLSAITGVSAVEMADLIQPWSKAVAATSAAPRRFVYIQQPTSPNRWQYDLFLNPSNSAACQPNTHVATRYTADANGTYVGSKYELQQFRGLWLPPIWGYAIPTASGGTTTANQGLLGNMLHLRGIDMGVDGHGFCQAAHMRPLGATTTTTAMVGDAVDAPLPAVGMSVSTYEYSSAKGRSPVVMPLAGDVLTKIMSPMTYRNKSYADTFYKPYATLIGGIENAANSDLKNSYFEAGQVVDTHKRALMILNTSFPDFAAEFTRLLNKYKDLIVRVRGSTFAGINDKPIGVDGSRSNQYQLNNSIINADDLRTLISTTTDCDQMARGFATTEFLLLNDLSYSIAFSSGTVTGLNDPAVKTHTLDEHFNGKMTYLLIDNFYFNCLNACMVELTTRLKAAGKWEDTVIEVGGEFNRTPRTDGFGSDHGFKAASVAIYSGAIKNGPYIVGDIKSTGRDAAHSGTYGEAAPSDKLNGIAMTIGNVASTLATLLRVPSPVTAMSSVVELKDSGEIVSLIGEPSIV